MGVSENRQDVVTNVLDLNIFPNPTNNTPTISYHLAAREKVSCSIYDATGREVRTLLSAEQLSGSHSIVWDGYDNNGCKAQPGVYFVRILTQEEQAQAKLIFLE